MRIDLAGRWAGAGRTDITVAGLLALLSAAESVARASATGMPGQFVVPVWLLALGTPLALALPRPVGAAIAVTSAAVLSMVVVHLPTAGEAAAQVIALYRLGRHGPARTGTYVLAAVLAAPFVVLALFRPGGELGVLTVLLAASAPMAAWVGFAARARGDALVHRTAREVIAGTMVEHTARGERARIARELHDVVAHHISMIAVQAETARLTTPGMPPAGAQRLLEIGDTARAGLTEMRRLLSVLRADASDPVADRRPQPGLQQLNELLDEARDAAGAATRLIVSGSPVPLDPGVELAAYRIVQEALTNARRHAPGAAADVELRYADDGLLLRIRDNGPGPRSEPTAGHGLLGMRERAAAVGGELRTGRAVGGGFLVEASLPTKPVDQP
ncbi:MAG TPA: sensor histidine kinase [Pseudonocardiaceae bacterium]|nr:sensor histidine kinase [Pseudonocardiaceae bacterium]